MVAAVVIDFRRWMFAIVAVELVDPEVVRSAVAIIVAV